MNAFFGDAFVAKLNQSGDALVYSTHLGGGGGDYGFGIAVAPRGQAYVTGITYSADFPTQNALQPMSGGSGDAFVAKLSRAGDALVYSTYLAGGYTGTAIAVDPRGQAYVTGSTGSGNFPTPNVLRLGTGGGFNAFVAKLSSQRFHPCHPHEPECATAKGNNHKRN